MYKTVTSFLLAKPTLDLFNVPDFLRLLNSKKLQHENERKWILGIIRDGLRDEKDYQVGGMFINV
jgi:nucleolar pre-ribosomal-associated protein 1